MINAPKTIEEARATRYGAWGGNPRGTAYDPTRCARQVFDPQSRVPYQCARKPGHGAGKLYCKQHAPWCPEPVAMETPDAR